MSLHTAKIIATQPIPCAEDKDEAVPPTILAPRFHHHLVLTLKPTNKAQPLLFAAKEPEKNGRMQTK